MNRETYNFFAALIVLSFVSASTFGVVSLLLYLGASTPIVATLALVVLIVTLSFLYARTA